MKLCLIGASSSAILYLYTLSNILKENVSKLKRMNLDIIVLEKNKIIGRKFLATGNGRCNIANKIINDFSYNNQETYNLVHEFNNEDIIAYFEKHGLKLDISKENYESFVYPFSKSAKSALSLFLRIINNNFSYINQNSKSLKAYLTFALEEKFLDYEESKDFITIKTDKKTIEVNKLIFATGGMSSPSLGSDGSIFKILERHDVKINELHAGLSPIRVRNNFNEIENERLKVKMKLESKEFKYEESGEVIFKKNYISGIVAFNIYSIIKRLHFNKHIKNVSLHLDLIPTFNEYTDFIQYNEELGSSLLYGIFSISIAKYLSKIFNIDKNNDNVKLSENKIKTIFNNLKDFKIDYVLEDDFKSSQVTIGGVSYSNLNLPSLSLKNNKNIHFIGEIIDSDGLCGGYNLMFCFASAMKVARSISLDFLNHQDI